MNTEIIEHIKVETPKKKTDQKTYRREYYTKRYNTDPEFKKMKKEVNKLHYTRKTKNCIKCSARIKLDSKQTECESCIMNKYEKVKSNRGRPRKTQQTEHIALPEIEV